MLRNREGEILFLDPIENGMYLGDRDLKRADFRHVTADALYCAGANLEEADFSYCDLYWPSMYGANCAGASFRNAKFEGADFKSACLRQADFSYAVVTHDRLGTPSTFVHANLEGAKFEGALLGGTEYDESTVFPESFDPATYGMIRTSRVGDLLEPPCQDK